MKHALRTFIVGVCALAGTVGLVAAPAQAAVNLTTKVFTYCDGSSGVTICARVVLYLDDEVGYTWRVRQDAYCYRPNLGYRACHQINNNHFGITDHHNSSGAEHLRGDWLGKHCHGNCLDETRNTTVGSWVTSHTPFSDVLHRGWNNTVTMCPYDDAHCGAAYLSGNTGWYSNRT